MVARAAASDTLARICDRYAIHGGGHSYAPVKSRARNEPGATEYL